MAYTDEFGPVKWPDNVYKKLLHETEDNNNKPVSDEDVEQWIINSEKSAKSAVKKVKSILGA